MCHAKQETEILGDGNADDDDAPPTPIRPGFYRDHVNHSPPHPPWTYPFDSAYEHAQEFVTKIKELEGGTILDTTEQEWQISVLAKPDQAQSGGSA